MKKTRIVLLIFLFLLVLFFIPTKVKAVDELVIIQFADDNLYQGVKQQISSKIYSTNDATNTIIMTRLKLLTIKSLTLSNKDITYLNGIDYFTNLITLNLSNNNISNILPLGSLPNLTTLNLSYNKISNVSPIVTLHNLSSLNLEHNEISDVAPVAKLTNLKILDLGHNSIRDISSFSTLSNLITLYLEENKVEDVSSLRLLTNLQNIYLQNQYYEYTVDGNVLSNIKTNINLPTFFVQSKKAEYANYSETNFSILGATLSGSSTYITLQNASAGSNTALVRINGGNADGSMMLLKYNSVIVTVTGSSSSPKNIYERVGGTISFTATANGDTSTNLLSISITKNGNIVTNNFQVSKSDVNSTTAKFNLKVPQSVSAGTYVIRVTYNNKIAVTGSFTVYENPPISSISLNATQLTLALNQSYKLEAIVLPTNVINKSITWTSSNPSIVSVDSNGNIVAKNYGTATITAKAVDGNVSISCIVNVPKPVTGVSLNLNKKILLLNESTQLIATITPNDATNQELTWQTNNSKVVSVSATGVITGKSIGYAVVTVTTKDGNYSASCHITVKEPDVEPQVIPVESISINKTALILVEGQAETLVATILPENATNKSFTWASDNEKVAKVDSNGNVTAISAGTAKIVATAIDSALGTKQAICEVTVVSNNITSDSYTIEDNFISSITVNTDINSFVAGLQIPLDYKIYDAKGTEIIYNTLVCTGMYIELANGNTYSLVVTGDVSGDGKITATDIFVLKKHITLVKKLDGAYQKAADINNNSSITITDLFKMKQIVVGL